MVFGDWCSFCVIYFLFQGGYLAFIVNLGGVGVYGAASFEGEEVNSGSSTKLVNFDAEIISNWQL